MSKFFVFKKFINKTKRKGTYYLKSRIFLSLLMGVLLVGVVTACGPGDKSPTADSGENKEPSSVSTIEEGKFTFGFSGLYKPFNYEDLNGELTGFDVEIGKALADEMGLEPNPVATQDFGALIEEVNSDRLDAIIGSMTITEERAKEVDFTDPYYRSGGVIYVHKDNNEIKSPEDLEGKTVGVTASSTYEEQALQYTSEDNLATYQSDTVALQDLAAGSGRLDAVITDKFVGFLQIEEAGLDIKAVGERVFDEEIGIAVKKGNQELLDELNRALKAIIEDGTYEEISQEYFGENILE